MRKEIKTKRFVMGIILMAISLVSCTKDFYVEPADYHDYVSLGYWEFPGKTDSVFAIVAIASTHTGVWRLKIFNKRNGEVSRIVEIQKTEEDSMRVFIPLADWPYDYKGELEFTADQLDRDGNVIIYKASADFIRPYVGMVNTGPDFGIVVDSTNFVQAFCRVSMWDSWNNGRFFVEQYGSTGLVIHTDTFDNFYTQGQLKSTKPLVITGFPGVVKMKFHWDLGDFHKVDEEVWKHQKAIVTVGSSTRYDAVTNSYYLSCNAKALKGSPYVNVSNLVAGMPKVNGQLVTYPYSTSGSNVTHEWVLGLVDGPMIVGQVYQFTSKINWTEDLPLFDPVNNTKDSSFNITIKDWVAGESVSILRKGTDSLAIISNISVGKLNIVADIYKGASLLKNLTYSISSKDTAWYITNQNPSHYTIKYNKSWNNIEGVKQTISNNW